MGLFLSSQQKLAQQKAKQIRQDLYFRVNNFLKEYQEQIDAIEENKKTMIIKSSAIKLCEFMDEGRITSYEIVLIFIERTIRIGIKNNYVIDEMFQEAVQKAKQIDSLRKQYPQKKSWTLENSKMDCFPPFFGVPISIKQSILIKDKISFVGFAHGNMKGKLQPSIMIMVQKMGFIPFVRTSVPQANHSYQTNNNILGYCKNPWDITRSCGGSSGGQGGLVGSYSSPFGLGSDLFGDTKIPCEFNGCVTLKPYARYTNKGNAFTSKYVEGLPFRNEFCPIVHFVEDIIKWNEFICDENNYTDIPQCLKDSKIKLSQLKRNILDSKSPKRIGYIINFSHNIKCSPSHSRAVLQTLKILQQQGHNIAEIEFKKAQQLNSLLFKLLYASNKLSVINENRKGQKLIKQFKRFVLYSKIPYFLLFIISKIIKKFMPKLSHQLSLLGSYKMKVYYSTIHEINVIRKQFYKYLKNHQIDAIISPGFFIPAYQLGESSNFTYYFTYSHAWNLLHYPVGCLPITTVRDDEQYFQDYVMDGVAKRADQNMSGSKGMPIGIQVISYPGQEELILNLMRTIQSHVDFNTKHKNKYFHKTMVDI